jgi:hypothetical protein
MVFLIYARIVLYRHRKSGHHLGSKASKIIAFISVLMGEKPVFARVFTAQAIFREQIQILFFMFCSFAKAKAFSLNGMS